MRNHVSWIVALVVGFGLGMVTTASLGIGGRRQAGPNPAAPPAPSLAAAPRPRPPTTMRKVPLGADDPVRGPANAPITLVLFSDFQCPFCSRLEPTLKQIIDAYPAKIRVVWKDEPLPMHPNAMPAAIAAEAAREQGKFWEMHDKLFAAQQDLNETAFERYAGELGLDLGKFKAAVAAKSGEGRISADQQLAGTVGANGTAPTIRSPFTKRVGVPSTPMRPATAWSSWMRVRARSDWRAASNRAKSSPSSLAYWS